MLTYSIAREWLNGTVNSESFSMRAWSGGGRGRVGSGAEHTLESYDTSRKEAKGILGGPLPYGVYICKYVANHPKFHECIFLQQTITSIIQTDVLGRIYATDRGGFYIHGRGEKGSDGCIVPENLGERVRLNRAIKASREVVLLKVAEPGMPLPAVLDNRTRRYA